MSPSPQDRESDQTYEGRITVRLTAEHEDILEEEVENRGYQTKSDAIRAAIEALSNQLEDGTESTH